MKNSIPSPSNNILRLQDSDIAHHFCELPDDTIFAESIAHNRNFRNGGFIPVQRLVQGQKKRKETHIYEITATSRVAKHIAGPILAPDGSSDITIFGCDLDSVGILYLCAFNRNSLLALDLTKVQQKEAAVCHLEICNIPAPNDVAIDPDDERILYTAGGAFRNLLVLPFTNAAAGRIYKTVLSDRTPKTTIVAKGLKTLAGIEVTTNGEIWTSQLFNLISRPKESRRNNHHTKIRWNGDTDQNRVWLADNVDTFGNNELISPAYTTVSKASVNLVLRRSVIASTVIFIGQALSAWMQGERLRSALRDPEVSLKFSNTYIGDTQQPEPIRFVIIDSQTPTVARHYEIDLVQTRAQHSPRIIRSNKNTILGKRHYFNEQVTHMASIGNGMIACVNFEQPRILMLDDSMFRRQNELLLAQAH